MTTQLWELRSLKPVSYTHLDVYKRQALDFKMQVSNWLATLGANLDLRSAICRHAIRMALCVAAGDWIEPVSYTHLDVYKRQALGW